MHPEKGKSKYCEYIQYNLYLYIYTNYSTKHSTLCLFSRFYIENEEIGWAIVYSLDMTWPQNDGTHTPFPNLLGNVCLWLYNLKSMKSPLLQHIPLPITSNLCSPPQSQAMPSTTKSSSKRPSNNSFGSDVMWHSIVSEGASCSNFRAAAEAMVATAWCKWLLTSLPTSLASSFGGQMRSNWKQVGAKCRTSGGVLMMMTMMMMTTIISSSLNLSWWQENLRICHGCTFRTETSKAQLKQEHVKQQQPQTSAQKKKVSIISIQQLPNYLNLKLLPSKSSHFNVKTLSQPGQQVANISSNQIAWVPCQHLSTSPDEGFGFDPGRWNSTFTVDFPYSNSTIVSSRRLIMHDV